MSERVLLSLFILLFAASVNASPSDLDPTFGSGGKVITTAFSSYDQLFDVASYPGGGVVTAGTTLGSDGFYKLLIEKRLIDGSLDIAFGSGGRIALESPPFGFGPRIAVRVQPDGKIIAAGDTTSNSFVGLVRIVRLNADGTVDMSFNSSGIVDRAAPYFQNHLVGIDIQTDNKIVMVSYTEGNFAGQNAVVITRFESDGTLDNSFGSSGVSTVFAGQAVNLTASALTNDGKIVGAGRTPAPERGVVIRCSSDGAPDPTFDGDGIVQTNLDSDPASLTLYDAIAVQPDGGVVVGGILAYGSNNPTNPDDSFVARYNANGILDSSFDGDGSAVMSLQPSGSPDRTIVAVAVQADGAIIGAAGQRTQSNQSPYVGGYNFTVIRLTPTGAGDGTWGTAGFVTTDLEGHEDLAAALRIQADGKVVVAGNLRTSEFNSRFTLIRYIGTPVPSAAAVSVSGRVTTADGNGLRNAVVTLTGVNGVVMSARTSSFGYYRFDEVAAGQTYVLNAVSKSFTFTPRSILVTDELTGIDLIAEP